jgi:hypothetical protein
MSQLEEPLFSKPARSASVGVGVAAVVLASATLLTGLELPAIRLLPDLYPWVFGGLLFFMTVSVPGGFLLSLVSIVIASVQLGRAESLCASRPQARADPNCLRVHQVPRHVGDGILYHSPFCG